MTLEVATTTVPENVPEKGGDGAAQEAESARESE